MSEIFTCKYLPTKKGNVADFERFYYHKGNNFQLNEHFHRFFTVFLCNNLMIKIKFIKCFQSFFFLIVPTVGYKILSPKNRV